MSVRLALCLCLGVITARARAEAPIADSPGDSPAAHGSASVADGELCVKTGDYEVKFVENVAWTFRDVHFKGKSLLVPAGWQQTVLNVKVPTVRVPGSARGTARKSSSRFRSARGRPSRIPAA